MEPEVAARAVGEEVLERFDYGAKREVFPRDISFRKKPGFKAFVARSEVEISELCRKVEMHLVHVGNVDQRERTQVVNTSPGFFDGFPCRTVGRGFAIFHEAGGQRPVAVARLYGTPAQQDLVFPDRDAPNDKFRVLVVDSTAIAAHHAGSTVAGWDDRPGRTAAMRAEAASS